ncbi:hypothetical protein AO888_20200 [Pseudomonas aeruginosa]|nr:hypothetical protein AO888_20200 [Pseudomonas aeruginosa]
MARPSKYGNMPTAPQFVAKVKGDAGVYKVWGFDWMHHRVLLDRAGLEWVPIKNVALEPAPTDLDD